MATNEDNKIFFLYLHLEEVATKSFRNQYIFNTLIQNISIILEFIFIVMYITIFT